MANEPARTIGAVFADQATIKALIGASIAILIIAGVNVAPGLADALVTIVSILVPVIGGLVAQRALVTQAHAQATQTREAVFSPASAIRIARNAAATGNTTVPPPPADA